MTPEQIKSALKICHLPPDDLDFVLKDVITESLSRILASVCKDDIAPIQGIVENEARDEFVCSAALAALVTLFAEGALERETLVDYCRDLSQKLPPEVAQQFKHLPKEKSKTDKLLEAQKVRFSSWQRTTP